MRSPRLLALGALAAGLLAHQAQAQPFGRTPSAAEIAGWDIDVRPDGKGLPAGRGSVAQGRTVYNENCAACHGPEGRNGIKDRLAGGQGTLASAQPVKTVGSYWPYATTLFDYIRRAMPYQAPGSLAADETYAVAAYILYLNGILPAEGSLDQASLPRVRMSNRDGFLPEREFTAGWTAGR